MLPVFIDFETYSDVELKKHGSARYMQYAEPLILAIKQHGRMSVCAEYDPLIRLDIMRRWVLRRLSIPEVVFVAHNYSFEKQMMEKIIREPISPSRFICTMALCAKLGLPLSLEKAAAHLGLAEKDKEGTRLIRKFSIPQKPTKKNGGVTRIYPGDDLEDFANFISYCKKDVEVEEQIFNKIKRILE